MGILILTKHEEIPTSNDFHPTVITLSPSYLPLITEFRYLIRNTLRRPSVVRLYVLDTIAGKEGKKQQQRRLKWCVCATQCSCVSMHKCIKANMQYVFTQPLELWPKSILQFTLYSVSADDNRLYCLVQIGVNKYTQISNKL